jgi:hypothetical protein
MTRELIALIFFLYECLSDNSFRSILKKTEWKTEGIFFGIFTKDGMDRDEKARACEEVKKSEATVYRQH